MIRTFTRGPSRTRVAALPAALAIALTAGCGGLLKSASEGIAKKACENLSPTSGTSGNCAAGASSGGATTTAAAVEPPLDTSDLPADWPAYLTPKTGVVKIVNAGDTFASVVFQTKSMNAREMGGQAKAAGCTTKTGSGITVSDDAMKLECGDKKISIGSGLGMLTVSRSQKSG